MQFFGFIFSEKKLSQLSDRWSLPSSVSLGIGRFVMIPKDRSSQDLHSLRENCEFVAELCANPEKPGGKDRKNTGLGVTHRRWWSTLSGQPAFVTSMPLVWLPYRIARAGQSQKGRSQPGLWPQQMYIIIVPVNFPLLFSSHHWLRKSAGVVETGFFCLAPAILELTL